MTNLFSSSLSKLLAPQNTKGRGREIIYLLARGLTSGPRVGGWQVEYVTCQGERPCSFPLRKTDVLPPPARRIPMWIISSLPPPGSHLCWVLKLFHSWNSTTCPCSPLAVDGAAGGTGGLQSKQTIPVVQSGCSSCGRRWERGNIKDMELGFG